MSKTIISITSFPPRIRHILPALESVIAQCSEDDWMVLWLGSEQFPHGKDDVPEPIISLFQKNANKGEIRFTKDIKSFKKLIPALQTFPNNPIITLDDDNYYPDGVISKLKKAAENDPNAILIHCGSDLYRSHGNWRRTTGNIGFIRPCRLLRMQTGGGGVYYPPNSLDKLVFNMDIAQKLCPTSDDIWFWFCAIRKGTPIIKIKNGIIRHKQIGKAAATGALSAINEKNDDEINLRNLRNLLNYDPSIEKKLLDEYNRSRFKIFLFRILRLLTRYPSQVCYCLKSGGFGLLISETKRKTVHFKNLITG